MAANREKVNSQKQFSLESGKTNANASQGEEVEVAAHLSIPNEGTWGWLVVLAGFFIMAIVDSIVFTFGSIIFSLTKEFNVHVSLASLINATTLFMYFSAGPVVSAIINRFGFRACAMGGSILSSFSVFICYFTEFYSFFYILYGLFAGFGYCCIQMSTTLVIGFYFQKLRLLALSLTFSGSCVGVMALSPTNVFIVAKSNWRTVILIQAGLLGIVYFLAMTYRPLLSVSVVTTIDDVPQRSVAILPSTAATPTNVNTQPLQPSKSEALFKSAGNANFPTAANIVVPVSGKEIQAGSSKQSISKITLVSKSKAEMSSNQRKQLKKISESVKELVTIKIEETAKVKRKRGCSDWCCTWEDHVPEQRPLYRDDVFYEGSITQLPVYHKSVATIPQEEQTGFEYQMAVARTAAVLDLKERRGFLTQSVRRVLATMLDLTLLKRRSFVMVCFSGFLAYFGYLIPFLCSVDRAVQKGLNPDICNFLISAIGISIMVGRLTFGFLGNKFDPVLMYWICHIGSGTSLVLSNFYFTHWYQFTCIIGYGFFAGTMPTLRSLVLVNLFGLEKLTNATGLCMLFCGVGGLIGSPCIIALSQFLNVRFEFYATGLLFILAGGILAMVRNVAKQEDANQVHTPKQPVVVIRSVESNIKT